MPSINITKAIHEGIYEGFRDAAAGKTLKLNKCQTRLLNTNKRITIISKRSGLI